MKGKTVKSQQPAMETRRQWGCYSDLYGSMGGYMRRACVGPRHSPSRTHAMPPVPHYMPHEKVSAPSDQTRLTMGAQDESLSSQERQNLCKAPKAAPSPAGPESQSHIRSGFSITHIMLCLCPSSAVQHVLPFSLSL